MTNPIFMVGDTTYVLPTSAEVSKAAVKDATGTDMKYSLDRMMRTCVRLVLAVTLC